MNFLLWLLQILLGLLFLFAGAVKLITPYEEMRKNMPVELPYWFLLFIGVCEILGGLGLVLPWLHNIRRWLTPLAAVLLAVIMAGAAALSVGSSPASAIFPLVVGIILLLIACRRRGELVRPQD